MAYEKLLEYEAKNQVEEQKKNLRNKRRNKRNNIEKTMTWQIFGAIIYP